MNILGLAMDWIEGIANRVDDPEAHPAGFAEPHYAVSETVEVSRDSGLNVYHVADGQLGLGSSLGNASAWAETKGTGDLLNFFSIPVGAQVIGGMSIVYMLPFSDLSSYGSPTDGDGRPSSNGGTRHNTFARAFPTSVGAVHLHPGYQQREFVIGDGLHVLETFFLPRRDFDDPAVAHAVVVLKNRTPHPIGITVVASAALRGWTARDMIVAYDEKRGAFVARNESHPEWVRVFGGDHSPDGYWSTTREEEAYSPSEPLPNRVDDGGDPTGVVQYDVRLLPHQSRKLRITIAFSERGEEEALEIFDEAVADTDALKETIGFYQTAINTSVVEMPEGLLSQAMQWAKTCLIRPLARYPIGIASTNDPGHSTHLVGRDIAWYVHGCDFVDPDVSCSLLRIFAERQRADGLIAEYIDGITGESVDHDFNINDNTPLFIMAVAHHVKVTGHQECLKELYEPARLAGELILSQRNEEGLVECTNEGMGVVGICGWRNVLRNEQITGVVTEINSECYAALVALADLAGIAGEAEDEARYRAAAGELRERINTHLINPANGLYVRNIDLHGNLFTQATVDLVFPLICGVAEEETRHIITARLAEPDFMSDAGIRALPSENPRYDPSAESGCLGGVWPGATWWYALGCSRTHPKIVAQSLLRSYWHYVADPKTYNTVPGQFSEWSDGQTLVNRGMRLSPWEAPRFIWAAIEGLAGLKFDADSVTLDPQLPGDWEWLRLHNLPYRDQRLSFFLIRPNGKYRVFTCNDFKGEIEAERYEEELVDGAESITTGLSVTAFRRDSETLICLGNSHDMPMLGPFLTHHALKSSGSYRVYRLTSIDKDWQDLGTIDGEELQRITVRVENRGYTLYKFIEEA